MANYTFRVKSCVKWIQMNLWSSQRTDYSQIQQFQCFSCIQCKIKIIQGSDQSSAAKLCCRYTHLYIRHQLQIQVMHTDHLQTGFLLISTCHSSLLFMTNSTSVKYSWLFVYCRRAPLQTCPILVFAYCWFQPLFLPLF